MTRGKIPLGVAAGALLLGLGGRVDGVLAANPAGGAVAPASLASPNPSDTAPTATPIKHLIVIYDENVSFDHYFATYPNAANPPGEPVFHAASGTPALNTLARPTC